MHVLTVAPQVDVPSQEGYTGQVGVYEHVLLRGLHVCSDVQVGLKHV